MPRRQPGAREVAPAGPGEISTKRRIEQSALQLFAAKGFEATGIRDIADRAGLSTATLYHYMGSKDELLVAFMVESMTELTRAARAALQGCADPAAQLAALVRTHVGFHTLDAQRTLVSDDELRALSDVAFIKVMQLRDGYEQLWAETLERGARSGEFSFPDARITRLALLEMCNGVARWYSDRGPKHPAQIAEAFADLALAMVGARLDGQALRLAELNCRPTREVLALVELELSGAAGHPAGMSRGRLVARGPLITAGPGLRKHKRAELDRCLLSIDRSIGSIGTRAAGAGTREAADVRSAR